MRDILLFLPLLVFGFGAVWGSFLNVVIDRFASSIRQQASGNRHDDGALVYLRSLGGRSYCPQCKAILRWWELVPLLSFTLLRGRCARCQAEINVQYPLVELGMGLLFLALARFWYERLPEFATRVDVVIALVVASVLVVLLVVDLRTMLLPDVFVGLLGIVAVIEIALELSGVLPTSLTLQSRLLGAGIGGGFLLVLWLLTRGRGIGLGDVKLAVPLGLFFGVWGMAVLLWLSFVAGGVVGIWLLLRRSATLSTPIPFGPFLCGAALLLLLFPTLPGAVIAIVFGIG